jgi:hypothetical protein
VTQEVRVEFRAEDSPLVAGIDPGVYPAYNVNDAGELSFDVEFTCPESLAGSKENISLGALVAARTVAAADTLVVCTEPKVEPQPENVLHLIVPTLVLPQRAPPAPPPAPPTVVESAPGTQQMFQAQPAAAAQEQEEVQTALVWQTTLRERLAAEEYSFSSVRRSDQTTPPWALYGAAAAMAMAYATASVRFRLARRFARN